MRQRVIKSGHSLAVTIPNSFVKTVGIKKGDEVQVKRRVDRGTLTLFFQGVQQLALSDRVLRKSKGNKN